MSIVGGLPHQLVPVSVRVFHKNLPFLFLQIPWRKKAKWDNQGHIPYFSSGMGCVPIFFNCYSKITPSMTSVPPGDNYVSVKPCSSVPVYIISVIPSINGNGLVEVKVKVFV